VMCSSCGSFFEVRSLRVDVEQASPAHNFLGLISLTTSQLRK